jgi:tetratricopeptide (TPR) repeat protein
MASAMVSLLGLLFAAPDAGAVDATAGSADVGVGTHAGTASPSARATARSEHEQAMTELRAGRIDEAARLFAAAVEHDPGNMGYATDYGFALGRLGRRREAEVLLRAAAEKAPHRVYAWLNLAEIYAGDPTRWERRDAIIAFLEKGLDAIKEDRKSRFNLVLGIANFERAIGRSAAARARLKPLLAVEAEPPLSRPERKRVLDLLETLALDDRAHALEDWPRPEIPREDVARANAAAQALTAGQTEQALGTIDVLARRYPTWPRVLVLRASALEAAGRVDEAARDLEVAVNLAPSNAVAWRLLGRILGQHGGALEAERADDALRNALTLEPGWTDLRELRDKLARRRATGSAQTRPGRATIPSDIARTLYQQAEEWIQVGDPVGLGRELLEQALADSPGFVAAAVSSFALSGKLPQPTLDALRDDGPGLWALAAGVRKLGQTGKTGKAAKSSDDVESLVRPLIDRAVALDVQEARFARAIARAAVGDRAGALTDLTAYVAREPNPDHLVEARALRAEIEDQGGPRADAQPSPQLLARIRLLEDKPESALRALGGRCARDVPGDRLVALGLVNEYAERLPAARTCYELAAQAGGASSASGLTRAANLYARLPDAELRKADRRTLGAAAAARIGAAEWALARLAEADGDRTGALERTDRALALAIGNTTDGDRWVDEARAARRRLTDTLQADADVRHRRLLVSVSLVVVVVLTGLGLLARRRWGGRTVAGALRRRPGLFPDVARAVGELRHDVLKHRASLLGSLADADAPRAEILRTMTEPRPTSAVVAAVYERVAQAASGHGTTLRALAREPLFGALHRDLARAEALLPTASAGGDAELAAIDERLRGPHADALAALLQLGPRTRLDAATLSAWIASVEGAARQAGGGWTAPALALADLAVDFPIEHDALAAIFMNLLRNAQAAISGQEDGRVIVRIDRSRDVTGRQEVSLALGDSAPAPLTLETIETRESGRGLAIVRDLVREWRGHMLVRPDALPYTKAVEACFPL